MLDRRGFIGGSLAAAGLFALPSRAQIADDGLGAPSRTYPFTPDVYKARRAALMARMNGGVAVVYSAASFDTSSPVSGLARQDSDFAYLTGIMDEAGAAIVLAPGERTYKEMLFLGVRNPDIERYEGERLAIGQNVRDRTGFERVQRIGGLGSTVAAIASRAGEMHFLGPLGSPNAPVPPALDLYGKISARVPGTRIVPNYGLIAAMRAAKEPREIALIGQAIAATERGLLAGMKAARPGMREFELKEIIETEFRRAGARGLAFPSIVATGRSSAVLHYTGGDGTIRQGDMILCDVGAEAGRYAADITRSFPVDGRFTPEQRTVYDTVLAAQEAALTRLRAGVIYEDLQAEASAVIRRAGHIDDFWHGLGHFVGLDVHDAGDYTAPLPVDAVVTIEPGIYLPQRNFGVRIEDDYRVTASGYDHMSRGTPRRTADVEAAVGRR